MKDSQTAQSSNGRIDETTAFDAKLSERSTLSLHTKEIDSVERSTPAASSTEVDKESSNLNYFRNTTDAFRTSLNPSSVVPNDADYSWKSQRVLSSESHQDDVFIASTVDRDFVFVSEMTSETTSPLVTEDDDRNEISTYRGVIEKATAGAINSEPSPSAVTEKLSASDGFNMSSLLETRSEKKPAVTSDSQGQEFSTYSTTIIVEDSEPTTNQLEAGSHPEVTWTLDSAEVNATVSELTEGTSDAFTEGENLSRERSDSSFLHESVSENVVWTHNATTPISLISPAEERAAISESHLPSETLHTVGRTVEDNARTPSTITDSPSAPLSTSEAAKGTQHMNDTEPVRRTQFSSQAVDQFSTVSEVASEAPIGLGSTPPNGQFIGVVVGATFAVVTLVVVVIIVAVVIYRKKRQKTGYITDYDLKDYRSLMKPMTVTSPSVVQPISVFSDVFLQDVTSNGPSPSKYKAVNFDRTSDDGLDGIEIVHDDSREHRSPKEIPIDEEFDQNPSGYSVGSYSVNTFRPPERKNEPKTTDLTQPETETNFNASEANGTDVKAIEK